MLSYKCSLFALMACMAVSGETPILRNIVVNVGENFTFDCFPPIAATDSNWYRQFLDERTLPPEYISRVDGRAQKNLMFHRQFINDLRVRSRYEHWTSDHGYFSLTILNMSVADSANYSCSSYTTKHFEHIKYDARVFGCSCTVDEQQNPDKKRVTCILDNHQSFAEEIKVQLIILTSNGRREATGDIIGNHLTFKTQNDLHRKVIVTFQPFRDFTGNISCIVPALPTRSSNIQRTTTVMSTSITTPTEKPTVPSTSRDHTFTNGNNFIISQDPVSLFPSSHAGNPITNIQKETGTHKCASREATLIVISAVGWSVVLMFVIAIVVLSYHRKRERAPSGSTPGRHETGEERIEEEETDMCYASIPDTSPPDHARKILGAGKGEFDGSSFPSDGVVGSHLYDFTIDDSQRALTTDPSTAGRHAGQSKQVR